MDAFHLTRMGQQFYEAHIPNIIDNLKTLSQEQAKANELKVRELQLKEQELRLKEAELDVRSKAIQRGVNL